MAADEKLIGCGVCPICGNAKARFTFSKKNLACMTCNACNAQIFARSDSSDEKLRGFVKAAPAAPAPAPDPAPAPAPTPAPAPDPAPPPPPPAKPTWGIKW